MFSLRLLHPGLPLHLDPALAPIEEMHVSGEQN